MSTRDAGPRLGRGLAALMGEAIGERDGAGVRSLAIDLLSPGAYQPRGPIETGSLDELAQSIRAHGILQPLLARRRSAAPGHYEIIAGERRWRAAQLAGLHEVPVLVRDFSDTDAMAAALVENLQREDLNPIEEAEGYKRLIEEFGLTQEALGQAVGKSRSHVANTMRLLGLPESVRGEVRRGALSAGHARALLAHPDPARAALSIIARGLNVRQTEAFASGHHGQPGDAGAPRRRPQARERNPETIALERELSERLGLQVDIAFDGKAGVVSLHYSSLDQLDGLIALLNPR